MALILAPREVMKIQRNGGRLPEAYYYQIDLVAKSVQIHLTKVKVWSKSLRMAMSLLLVSYLFQLLSVSYLMIPGRCCTHKTTDKLPQSKKNKKKHNTISKLTLGWVWLDEVIIHAFPL